jgi:glucosamine--fructose-6-phosphate aminotransferase (isomerizing)
MKRLPMLENILAQTASLRAVLELQEKHAATLKACAERLCAARGRVLFTGMGASYFAAMPAVCRLQQHGFAVEMADSSELLHFGSSSVRQGDVVVLISRSGGSVEVLLLAEKLRSANVALIGVTNLPDTDLARAVDLTLQIGSGTDQIVAIQTYTGTILTLLLLAEQMIAKSSVRLRELCNAALPTLSEFIDECLQRSESWRELLLGDGPLYLLGRGPSLASVHGGALLLHETAKASAVGMSCGQFRHGPVESVSAEFRAVVFGTPSVTRTLNQSLADDLSYMGAKVRWIGPVECEMEAAPLVFWPRVEDELAQIFEIVPLQVAAYQLALWRGITPGDFRYASAITAGESGFPLFQSRQEVR